MNKRRDLPSTVPNTVLTEGNASASLCGHADDGLEAWLAEQRWRAALDGSWAVEPDRGGCTYRVEGVPGGGAVRVVERGSGAGAVTSWLVV